MSENVPQIKPVTIKIEKGLGISHALKKLVEEQKMELTDGKITSKEWGAVLDKLIEIQQNRQANGKSSIFSGGTDKTSAGFHNSFVVHPEQEIQFTAEEIESLYTAMGATFTKDSKPVEKKENKPVETPGPNGTIIRDGNYFAKDGTELEDQYARGTELKFESGASARVWENGVKVTYRNSDGKVVSIPDFMRNYPEAYQEVVAQQFMSYAGDNAVNGMSAAYKCDENGNIKGAEFNLNGKRVYAQAPIDIKAVAEKFGIQPKPVEEPEDKKSKVETKKGTYEEKRTDEAGSEYTAQIKDGKEITRTYYEDDGKTVSEKFAYEYDSAGKVSKQTTTRGDGTLRLVTDYENGKEITQTYYEDDGKTVSEKFAYEYDSAGKTSKETYTRGDGTLCYVTDYENGKEKTKTYYEDDGKTVSSTYSYEYDSAGNKSKKTGTRGDGTVYQITSYENGKEKTNTYYDDNGKTVRKNISEGQLKMIKLPSKASNGDTVYHEYVYGDNGVCIKSSLSELLKSQIDGWSMNANTIKYLKRLTPQNIIKVLSSYEYIAGKPLQTAIGEEWGLNDESIEYGGQTIKVKDLIPTILKERAEELELSPDESGKYDLEKLLKLDAKYSRIYE